MVPGHETILVVENEPAVRRLFASTLERDGYRLLQARTGQEALEQFDASVDLLIVDLHLPHLSGQEVIARLHERHQSLKVLAISGYPPDPALPPDVAFLPKPFAHADLVNRIREVIGGGD